ncbi:MAG: class I SAM-dependent methyltransferase [Candidatus Brocadiaceae bacterium]|nr:class I SAM-dependent methyltransferase [Candidatus Brocadiaceae bacterium]
MDTQKNQLFKNILTAGQTTRKKVSEDAYDKAYENLLKNHGISNYNPKQRRLERISNFKHIIGQSHERILEIGCGLGDLTCALASHATSVIGIDISAKAVEAAINRRDFLSGSQNQLKNVEFLQMSAVNLNFPSEFFDWVISTSMIEHLHPEDVDTHLLEVLRILKPKGMYLVWCPNRLGHHKNREGHLCMFSYHELKEKMENVGFCGFKSTLISGSKLVNADYKVFLEKVMSGLKIKFFWSHLRVRNILLVASKGSKD